MTKGKLKDFGVYEHVSNKLAKAISDKVNKPYEEVRETILDIIKDNYFAAVAKKAAEIRENKIFMGVPGGDITLNYEENRQAVKAGLEFVCKSISAAYHDYNINAEIEEFQKDMHNEFNNPITEFYYEADHASILAKYAKLEELKISWPYREADIKDKTISTEGAIAACMGSRAKTLEMSEKFKAEGNYENARLVTAKFNWNIGYYQIMRPDITIPPLDPIIVPKEKSFIEKAFTQGTRSTIKNFGMYEERTNELANSIAAVVGKPYQEVREFILTEGTKAYFAEIGRVTEIAREEKRKLEKEDLTLTQDELLSSYLAGFKAIEASICKSYDEETRIKLEPSFKKFFNKLEILFGTAIDYLYELDHNSALAKYAKLKELGEVYPFRDKEMKPENLEAAFKAACEVSRAKTLELVSNFKQNNNTYLARLFVDRFNWGMDLLKPRFPNITIAPIDPIIVPKEKSFVKAFNKEAEPTQEKLFAEMDR
jgi:hypothetical protein